MKRGAMEFENLIYWVLIIILIGLAFFALRNIISNFLK